VAQGRLKVTGTGQAVEKDILLKHCSDVYRSFEFSH